MSWLMIVFLVSAGQPVLPVMAVFQNSDLCKAALADILSKQSSAMSNGNCYLRSLNWPQN